MNDSSDGFVMVPVPPSRVQEVYALLGSAPKTSATASSQNDAETDGWTEPLLQRLFNESGDSARDFLRCLAEADGAEVSTNEVARRLNLPNGARSVAGMTGAIGRRVANRYKMEGVPWNARWRHIDPSDHSRGTETLLSMPTWMCDVIKPL